MEKSVKGIPYLENVKKGVFRGVFIFYGESFMEGGKNPERTLQWKIDVYKMQNNMARGIFAEKRGGFWWRGDF